MGINTFNLDEPLKSKSLWKVEEINVTTYTWKNQHVYCLCPIKF